MMPATIGTTIHNKQVRTYPNTPSQAVRIITADIVGMDASFSPTARRMHRYLAPTQVAIWLWSFLTVFASTFLLSLKDPILKHVPANLPTWLRPSPSDVADWPTVIYFLPLAIMLVITVMSFKHLWLNYPTADVNWSRIVFLAYLLNGALTVMVVTWGLTNHWLPFVLIWGGYFVLYMLVWLFIFDKLFRYLESFKDWVALALIVAVCVAVGIAVLAGIESFSKHGMVDNEAAWVEHLGTYGFWGLIMALIPCGFCTYRRWFSLRQKVRSDCTRLADAATDAIGLANNDCPGRVAPNIAERLAADIGRKLGNRLVKTAVTHYALFVNLAANSMVSSHPATAWPDVESFQNRIFCEGVRAAICAEYPIQQQPIPVGDLDARIINSRSEMAFEPIRYRIAQHVASTLYNSASGGNTSSVINISEEALRYASLVSDSAAHSICDLAVSRIIEQRRAESRLHRITFAGFHWLWSRL